MSRVKGGAGPPAAAPKLSSRIMDMKFMRYNSDIQKEELTADTSFDANISLQPDMAPGDVSADAAKRPALFGENESAWYWPRGLRPASASRSAGSSSSKPSMRAEPSIGYAEIAAEEREQGLAAPATLGRRSYMNGSESKHFDSDSAPEPVESEDIPKRKRSNTGSSGSKSAGRYVGSDKKHRKDERR